MKTEFGPLLRLASPIVLVQVGMMAMSVVDTALVGRVSAGALAAVALGQTLFFGAAVFGMGALMALDPVVAQAHGAGDREGVGRGVQRGLVLSAALTVPCSLALVPAGPILGLLGQPGEVVPIAGDCALASIPGIFPFLAFTVFRQSLQAMHRIAPIVAAMFAALVAHVLLCWAMVFGHAGLPAMGAVGAAWAGSISRWLMALGLLAAAWPDLKPLLLPWRRSSFEGGPLIRMLRLGAPIGTQFLLEFGAFAVIGLLMGRLGANELAGHQIALSLASLTFMVPLGVSAAAAVRVGNAVGEGDMTAARRAAAASMACGVLFMALTAALFMSAPGILARLYTTDAGAFEVAAVLIPLAGVFQIFDGLQVVSTGILRGSGDTRAPMLINVLGFWLIGMPVSLVMAFSMGAGPAGLWWGLVVALVVVSASLLARVRSKLRGEIARVRVDGRAETQDP
ncbi:MAG TPA: MATE family efflux transporter [Planctomycetota bacterium]|nr:MATE family efflux transporter [Planctomycetota bacterium]